MYKILIILFFFTACCPSYKVSEKRIAKMVECNPSLKKKDTIIVRDTVITEKLNFQRDTLLTHDTLVITKEGARVRIVRKDTVRDTIPVYVDVECPPDTVYFSKEVPVESIQVTDYKVPFKDKVINGIVGILIFIVILAAVYFLMRRQ